MRVGLLAGTVCYLVSCFVSCAAGRATGVITDVRTDKARYPPQTPVKVYVSLANPASAPTVRGTVRLECSHLDQPVTGPREQTFALRPGDRALLTFDWTPPATDYQGYFVEASARDSSNRTIDARSTAVDVSSSWLRFPRYGFLTTFGGQSRGVSSEEVSELESYHIDALQFYDWQYKHHLPLAGTVARPAATWPNLASTPAHPLVNERRTILDLIDVADSFDIATMNYNLLYGAWRNYSDDGVDYRWGLWKKPNRTAQDSIPLPKDWQTDVIYLFSPADVGWQNYLFKQEANVFAAYPFDGWHVDQVGDRGIVYDYAGNPVRLAESFAPFLNRARLRLGKTIIFNSVGGFGLDECAQSSTEDAVYVECWERNGQKTYADLKAVIDEATAASKGTKAAILAAYMDKGWANSRSSEKPGTFNLPGLLLTDTTIFASGGSHIEMGDGAQMLCSEYFPNRNLILSDQERRSLRSYYDFLTAYENLLRGGMSNAKNAIVLDRASSANAQPGAIWTFAKTGGGYQALHFINLMGEDSNLWRDDEASYPAPAAQSKIEVKYYYQSGAVQNVNLASPDIDDGRTTALPFAPGADAGGNFVRFAIPRLNYWDVVYLRVK